MTFHDNSVFILLKFIIEFLIFILTNFVWFASWFCIINIWLQRSDGWTLDDNAEYLFYLFSHISWRICRISAESSSTWLFKIKVYTLDIKFSSWGWALSQSKVSACRAMKSLFKAGNFCGGYSYSNIKHWSRHPQYKSSQLMGVYIKFVVEGSAGRTGRV